jgi:hypothetical protein
MCMIRGAYEPTAENSTYCSPSSGESRQGNQILDDTKATPTFSTGKEIILTSNHITGHFIL